MPTPPELLRVKLAHLIKDFVPEATVEKVVQWIMDYKIKLTVANRRQSVYGDYRNPDSTTGHRISVNGDLNKYAFLITFIHEMAHLMVWEHHKNRVRSHGQEWKNIYSRLLSEFLADKVFPEDICAALTYHINNPAASSCTDNHLTKTLSRYNSTPVLHLEDLTPGDLFKIQSGRIFRLENKLRKRYKCVEVKTNTVYLFSAVAEVKRIQKNVQTV